MGPKKKTYYAIIFSQIYWKSHCLCKNIYTCRNIWPDNRLDLQIMNLCCVCDPFSIPLRYEWTRLCLFGAKRMFRLILHLAPKYTHGTSQNNSGVLCQKQVSRARTSNYIPQILWDLVTSHCPWYLLVEQQSWIVIYIFILLCAIFWSI